MLCTRRDGMKRALEEGEQTVGGRAAKTQGVPIRQGQGTPSTIQKGGGAIRRSQREAENRGLPSQSDMTNRTQT